MSGADRGRSRGAVKKEANASHAAAIDKSRNRRWNPGAVRTPGTEPGRTLGTQSGGQRPLVIYLVCTLVCKTCPERGEGRSRGGPRGARGPGA